jgi:hypothetical protein
MNLAEELSLLEEFERCAAVTRRARQWELMEERRFDDQRRHEREEREDRETLQAALLASQAQMAEFHSRLDTYDTATVEALMDNQRSLDDVDKKLDEMRSQAFVLPDGRRAFKTADGLHVFDEAGTEVRRDTLDPDMISGSGPTWEAFKAGLDSKKQLQQERSGLLEFQARVDAAREKIDGGKVTKTELDALGSELENAMPDAVRRRVAPNATDVAPPKETAPGSGVPGMPLRPPEPLVGFR